MALWNGDTQNPHKDSKSARLALSAYEEAIFKDFLRKNPVERAYKGVSNDRRTPLSQLFSIFH